MSTVMCLKDEGKIWMATDSQVSRGNTKKILTNPNSFKIWRPAGHKHLIMGGVGALRDLNVLSTVDVWFDEIEVSGSVAAEFDLTFSYVVRTIAPAIFEELGVNRDSNVSCFILAYKDRAFSIDVDGCVEEVSEDGDFNMIGSGAVIAEAAYQVLADLPFLSVKEKIIRAVGQSCEQEQHVGYPILLMNTEDMALEIFDGEYLYVQEQDEPIPFEEISEYEFSKSITDEDILDADDEDFYSMEDIEAHIKKDDLYTLNEDCDEENFRAEVSL